MSLTAADARQFSQAVCRDPLPTDQSHGLVYGSKNNTRSAIGLIREGQAGDDPERIREGMSGNLCRCGAYAGITEAVLEAQKNLARTDRRHAA